MTWCEWYIRWLSQNQWSLVSSNSWWLYPGRLTLVFPWWQRSQSIRKADASDFSVQGHDTASLLLNNTAGQHQTTGCPTWQEFVSFAEGLSMNLRTVASYGPMSFHVFPQCFQGSCPLLPPRWWQVRWQTGRPFSPLSTSFVPRWNDWEIPRLPCTECWAGCWRDRPPLQMAHLGPENPEGFKWLHSGALTFPILCFPKINLGHQNGRTV